MRRQAEFMGLPRKVWQMGKPRASRGDNNDDGFKGGAGDAHKGVAKNWHENNCMYLFDFNWFDHGVCAPFICASRQNENDYPAKKAVDLFCLHFGAKSFGYWPLAPPN